MQKNNNVWYSGVPGEQRKLYLTLEALFTEQALNNFYNATCPVIKEIYRLQILIQRQWFKQLWLNSKKYEYNNS